MFTGVGEMLGSNPNLFVKAAVHGVAGGALSVAQGGNFLQGFAANAVGAFAGGASDGAFGPGGASPDIIAHTLIVAAAGCASASITGGKCADAAVTAAFANIYNAWGARLGYYLGSGGATACVIATSGACGPLAPWIVSGGVVAGAGLQWWLTRPAVPVDTGPVFNEGNAEDRGETPPSPHEVEPKDRPSGTQTIDKWGISRPQIHEIKDSIGAGAADWVGVTVDGGVITTGNNGNTVNHDNIKGHVRRPNGLPSRFQ